MWIRVKDPSTGHEFDVPETSPLLRKGLVEHVKPKQYPPSYLPRPPKHRLNLAGRPAKQDQPASADAGQATETEE